MLSPKNSNRNLCGSTTSDYVSLYMFGFNGGFPVNRRVRFEGLKPLKKASKQMTLKNVTRCCFTCIKISAETA